MTFQCYPEEEVCIYHSDYLCSYARLLRRGNTLSTRKWKESPTVQGFHQNQGLILMTCIRCGPNLSLIDSDFALNLITGLQTHLGFLGIAR